MAYVYDDQNIFAKILRGEIPSSTVLATEHCLAFQDISEQAPVHVLVIPRGPYLNFDHFAVEASEAEIVDFSRTIGKVCQMTAVSPDNGGGGYRDRKSTRLNSSHVVTSYAVFCLKKKTPQHYRNPH